MPQFASKGGEARVCIVHKANLLIYHPAETLLPPPASAATSWWRKVAGWSLSAVNLYNKLKPVQAQLWNLTLNNLLKQGNNYYQISTSSDWSALYFSVINVSQEQFISNAVFWLTGQFLTTTLSLVHLKSRHSKMVNLLIGSCHWVLCHLVNCHGGNLHLQSRNFQALRSIWHHSSSFGATNRWSGVNFTNWRLFGTFVARNAF